MPFLLYARLMPVPDSLRKCKTCNARKNSPEDSNLKGQLDMASRMPLPTSNTEHSVRITSYDTICYALFKLHRSEMSISILDTIWDIISHESYVHMFMPVTPCCSPHCLALSHLCPAPHHTGVWDWSHMSFSTISVFSQFRFFCRSVRCWASLKFALHCAGCCPGEALAGHVVKPCLHKDSKSKRDINPEYPD